MNFESKRHDSTSGKSSFSPPTGESRWDLTWICHIVSDPSLPQPTSTGVQRWEGGNVLVAICCSGALSHRQSFQCWSTVKCLIGVNLSHCSQGQIEALPASLGWCWGRGWQTQSGPSYSPEEINQFPHVKLF